MGNDKLTKEEMIEGANLVIHSVDFLEAQIERKLLEIEVAVAHHRHDQLPALRQQAKQLLNKLNQELVNMDVHYAQCKETSDYEEKKLLSSLCSGNQVSVWGISSNSGWLSPSPRLQEKVKAYTKTGLCSKVI